MLPPAAQRQVDTGRSLRERGCLYCLRQDGPFQRVEHVVPRRLGPKTDRYVLEPGAVCDPCNHWLGRQVDAPFTSRFDITVHRALEGLSDRQGRVPAVIQGRDATCRLDLEISGGQVAIFAARADETHDGGLDIEIRPQERDPPDIAARTMRALWKIALGCAWGTTGRDFALDPRWDDLRRVVLGAPFRGYVLQAPFEARVTRRLDVNVAFNSPDRPDAITFEMGGVRLAAPLAAGTSITLATAKKEGWDVHATDVPAPHVVRLRLEPDKP